MKHKSAFFIAIALFILAIFFAPNTALKLVQYIAVSIILVMACLRIFAVCWVGYNAVRQNKADQPTTCTPPKQWPRFIVLVPLFKEAHVVKKLMQALEKLDYPHDKLNIIMVCEIDDHATWAIVKRHMRTPFTLFKVGPSEPRTKPKALNAALASIPNARADDIITIYDAEDRPHPNQLKAAAHALMSDPNLAAVQAPLGYYNNNKNLLTQFFTLEYAALFHVWNPALNHLHLPFTLGGTSNHIKRDVLEAAGGWDSYNVTEDADLSFRMTAMNRDGKPLKIGCIGYGTQEEAVDNPKAWVHQRSRWLKGFMQTWAVHMREKPLNPEGKNFNIKARIKNAVSLQLTVGATLFAAFLHVPSLLLLGGLFLADAANLTHFTMTPLLIGVMGFGYGAAILTGIAGALKAGQSNLVFLALLMPFYWLLQFPVALIAAWEFITAPSYWRKTEHARPSDNYSYAPDLDQPVPRII